MCRKNRVLILILTVLIVTVLAMALVRPYRISGDCMEPAMRDGRFCFLNRLSPYVRQYKINDIILFNYEGKVWISRIVALENDTIHIQEGIILVNGINLKNDTIKRNWLNWKYGTYAINNPLSIPKDHVFVLSDNLSAHHDDSRVFGPIHKSSILGLVW